MTMAAYKYGKPVMVANNPAVAYKAGDVVVIGNTPFVAHEDNPAWSGNPLTPDAFAAGGGVYTIPADAAYGNGTSVYWDTVKQQVTTVYKSGVTFPFGQIVGGPSGNANDGGPTGATSLCDVYHLPVPALLGAPQGAQPLANFRNLIDGGDFTTNPWQRGTSQAADITNTVTYGPDRFFFMGGASSAIDWSQVADTTLAGFNQCLKMQRKSANANTAALNLGQVLESADCIKAQGQQVTLSFYAKVGANYSGGALTVALNHSITAGNDTAAHLVAASTNWQATPTIINTTQALTTGWVRYQFTGTVPAAATQLGLLLTWTPTGTAGTDDSISFQGFQLEIGSGASPFEHRDVEVELALCQRFFFQINEPASGVIVGAGMITSTNNETIFIPLPVQMRTAPTVSVTAGTFKFNIAGTATAAAGLAAGTTHTPNYISVVGTTTATSGQGTLLQGGGGSGLIAATADF